MKAPAALSDDVVDLTPSAAPPRPAATSGTRAPAAPAPAPAQAARRRHRLMSAAVALIAATLFVGRLVLDRTSFPARHLSIPVGSWFETASDWFVANMAWLYDPVASALTGALDQLNSAIIFTPPPQLAALLVLLTYAVAGIRLALLTAVTLVWCIAAGDWEPTMQTLAFMLIAVLVSCVLGTALGVGASLNRRLSGVLTTGLDAMQAFPIFAYLVPVVLVFGTGDAGALVVTIIWAMPPVARMTLVGLQSVSQETVESATSFGANRWQLLRDVRLPLARPSIAAGVNQTIMFAISMATISAMVGGSGLGQVVWGGLSRLSFGDAIEGGLALVLIAVILDRASAPRTHSTAQRGRFTETDEPAFGVFGRLKAFARRHPRWAVSGVLAVVVSILANALPQLRFADFTQPPSWLALDLRKPSEEVVNWTTVHLGGLLDWVRNSVQSYGLNPVMDVLHWIPWPTLILAGFLVGLLLLGLRAAVLVAAGVYLIGAMGMWDATIVTVAVVGVSVVLAVVIGFPLGVAMSRSDRLAALIRPVLDLVQTLPIFLFVIPAVIFMGSGPVTGTLATVGYALPPIIRLTNIALRNADGDVVEAAKSFGATERQILLNVRAPLGLPTILVGLNQTVLLALAMAVVAAFVGTPGLGQEILVAVNGAHFGVGVEAGIAMFILAVAFDRLFRAWTARLSIGSHLKVM
ncbi:ABC transporter permease [Streptomyces lanatus]|uniref:ABC transporter permease subunit n=1 Tax=Streptomyces lanatus TaxID=66900 RepID=A0ABV1Y650_9ACTN|nr:ABC transporter permease subunit [Streptomyces lanatus]GHH30212.1 glycine/betaine ABC transporter permease [Streptomyces lanatus]